MDYENGKDENGRGSQKKPLKTIAAAVTASEAASALLSSGGCTVLLREGTHVVEETIQLGPENSGLSFQNFEGEKAIVSGAVPFSVAQEQWKPVRVELDANWEDYEGWNNVYALPLFMSSLLSPSSLF